MSARTSSEPPPPNPNGWLLAGSTGCTVPRSRLVAVPEAAVPEADGRGRMLRIGVVGGAGTTARDHATALARMDTLVLIALVDTDAARLSALSHAFPGVPAFSTVSSGLVVFDRPFRPNLGPARLGADVSSIHMALILSQVAEAVTNSSAEAWICASDICDRVPVCKELLGAGKTVLCEQPLSDDVHAAESLAPFVDTGE